MRAERLGSYYRAGSGICQRDHLGASEAPFRLAEEKSEHALLDR